MWTFDDAVRDAISASYALLREDKYEEFLASVPETLAKLRDLNSKELEVLLPTSYKLLSDEEFVRMSKNDHEIGYAIINEEDFSKEEEELTREYQEIEPDVLAIKGLGQFSRFKAASAFRQPIENWHVSDFHINLARGSKDAAGEYEHLSVSGENLQLVAQHIYENEPKVFQRIVTAMKHRVPDIGDVETIQSPDGRLLLGFRDQSFKDPFIDRHVSDGTIKMFAYLILLYDPHPHPLLCVEAPGNRRYSMLLRELAEEFRTCAERGGPVFVSSHFRLFECARKNGQIAAFMKEGDKTGYLWKQ